MSTTLILFRKIMKKSNWNRIQRNLKSINYSAYICHIYPNSPEKEQKLYEKSLKRFCHASKTDW